MAATATAITILMEDIADTGMDMAADMEMVTDPDMAAIMAIMGMADTEADMAIMETAAMDLDMETAMGTATETAMGTAMGTAMEMAMGMDTAAMDMAADMVVEALAADTHCTTTTLARNNLNWPNDKRFDNIKKKISHTLFDS
jgi:hypothetical protein